MARLREKSAVQAQYQIAAAVLGRLSPVPPDAGPEVVHDVSVMRAVADSLAWVLGSVPSAPVTGRHVPHPAARDIYGEWARAEAICNGSYRLPAGLSARYVSAVQQALEWLQLIDDEPPVQPVSDAGIAAAHGALTAP